jgi:hypothetical protein
MNSFQRHGIKHLSPSSLLTYQNNPAMWVGKYLFGWRDDAGPRAWLGGAVETGLHSKISGAEDFMERALHAFDEKAQGEIREDIEDARQHLRPMLQQACEAYKTRIGARPLYQVKCEWWIDGIEVPVIGYLDFEWPEQIDDLKTTLAIPSKPRPDHVAQIAMYMKAREKDCGSLLYVSPKKFAQYQITMEQAEEELRALVRSAKAIRHMLGMARDKNDAARIFAPDFSDFRWNETTKALAIQTLEAR